MRILPSPPPPPRPSWMEVPSGWFWNGPQLTHRLFSHFWKSQITVFLPLCPLPSPSGPASPQLTWWPQPPSPSPTLQVKLFCQIAPFVPHLLTGWPAPAYCPSQLPAGRPRYRPPPAPPPPRIVTYSCQQSRVPLWQRQIYLDSQPSPLSILLLLQPSLWCFHGIRAFLPRPTLLLPLLSSSLGSSPNFAPWIPIFSAPLPSPPNLWEGAPKAADCHSQRPIKGANPAKLGSRGALRPVKFTELKERSICHENRVVKWRRVYS